MGFGKVIKINYAVMKKIYKLKPRHELIQDPTGTDKKRREKVEETTGPMSNSDWWNFKMLMDIRKNKT